MLVEGWEECCVLLTLGMRDSLREGTQDSLILEVDFSDSSISCRKDLRNIKIVS